MDLYEQAWKAIISPPKIKGKMRNYGPAERVVNGCKILREDIRITNKNNKTLAGLLFHAPELNATETVVYLHGNGGTKYQALPLVDLIPKFRMNVAAFDFLGCGNSDQAYLTYGIKEIHDVKLIVDEIKSRFPKQKITLWGRSMGAQCCIMYAQMYPNDVSGMVLDSPFQKLEDVIDRIAVRQVPLPQILIKPALYLVKNTVKEKSGQDIFAVDYVEVFKKVSPGLPVLFIYSHFDKTVPTEEVMKFYKAHKGPKDLCEIFQTHDEDRPEKTFSEGLSWMHRVRKNLKNKFISEEILKEWIHYPTKALTSR